MEYKGKYRKMGEGIFELRAIQGSNISRALYFFFVEQRIIITHGFIKKTVKTPRAQIDRAKQYREDFLKREKKRKQVKK